VRGNGEHCPVIMEYARQGTRCDKNATAAGGSLGGYPVGATLVECRKDGRRGVVKMLGAEE